MCQLGVKHRARRRIQQILLLSLGLLGRLVFADHGDRRRVEDTYEQLIKDTINAQFTWDPPSWSEALYTEVPRLQLSKIWQPPQPADGSAAAAGAQIPITVFTALSLQRLGQLHLLCKSWPGPMVAAVWLPVVLPPNNQPITLDYYTQQLQEHEQRKAKQQDPKAKRRRRNQQKDGGKQQAAGSHGKKGKKRRSSNSTTASKGKANSQDLLKSQLKLQQRQLERLQQVLQELQQVRAQQLLDDTQSQRRTLKAAASLLTDPPLMAKQQVEGAMEAVEALLQSIQQSRTLTPPMHFFQAQAAKMENAATSNATTLSAKTLKQLRRLLANPAVHATSTAASTNATGGSNIGSGSGSARSAGKANTLLKSAFVSRSNYLNSRNKIYAHHGIHKGQSKVAADSTTPFSGANMLGSLPACQLTVMLFIQVFRDSVAPLFLFPINTLRNYAALMARTPLVSMVDVDLTFNARFASSLLTSPARVTDLVRDATSGSLLVPPAFEAPLCRQAQCKDGVAAGRIASFSTKAQLQALLQRGWIDSFHCSKGTHWLVDYKRWFNTMDPYEVRYARGAEPWYIAHKAVVPWYDTRLKGYGFNKQLQVLYATGNMRMRVRVLPDAWLIHIPHHHTAVSHAFKAKGQVTTGAAAQTVLLNASDTVLNNTSSAQSPPSALPIALGLVQSGISNTSQCEGSLCQPSLASGNKGMWQQLSEWRQELVQAITSALQPGSSARGVAKPTQAAQQTQAPNTASMRGPGDALPTSQDSAIPRILHSTARAIKPNPSTSTHSRLDVGITSSGDLGTILLGPTTHEQPMRGLQATEGALAHHKVQELLLALYAKMFSAYTWPLGKGLLTWDSNRMPDGEHPHVDDAMKVLAAQLPWWTNYTSRWHEGQPSAVRPPYMDPPALSAWPVATIKRLKSKLEMCATNIAPDGATNADKASTTTSAGGSSGVANGSSTGSKAHGRW